MEKSQQKRMLASQRLFQKTVGRAVQSLRQGNLQSTIAWSKIAAHFAFARHFGIYTSPLLESVLVEVAHRIEIDPPNVSGAFYLKSKPQNYGKMRFLHIITETYDTGGHSSFVARWITNTLDSAVHSVITTSQASDPPRLLLDAIRQSGGWYCALRDLSDNLVEQALLMRLLAQSWTDVVVLFVHPFDPLPTVSFGIEGGPPVLFCNHADHAFWLGTSVADVVVDYHSSAGKLSEARRGVTNSAILPIPLSNKEEQDKSFLRIQLGIEADAFVLLTIGREEKYAPIDGYDFLEVMVETLKRHPNAVLFAVGPAYEGRWQKASQSVEGRIRVLGPVDRSILEKYYAVADAYAVSFPCASGTAMLEAGLHNLPIVGLHIDKLSHLSLEDDVAFKPLSVHAHSVEEFSAALDQVMGDVASSRQVANLVKQNIEREHCPPGWNLYLDSILQSLPSQHTVHYNNPQDEYIDYADFYFEQLCSQMLCGELPEHSLARLVSVYRRHLNKAQVVRAQVSCLAGALPKVNSLAREKAFVFGCKDLVVSAFT